MVKQQTSTLFSLARQRYKDPYYQGKPAELSFYFMFSFIPSILLLLQLLSAFSITPAVLEHLLADYLSSQGLIAVRSFLDSTSAEGYGLIFLATALWGASKLQYAMGRLSDYAYTGSTAGQHYIAKRLRALKNSLLMFLGLLSAFLLLAYGKLLLKALPLLLGDSFAQAAFAMLEGPLQPAFAALRWTLGVIVYALSVIYLFYSAPRERPALRNIAPGSLMAALGMVLVTVAYSAHLNAAYLRGSWTKTLYGSFSTVVTLLFWFFLLGTALVAGVIINGATMDYKALSHQKDSQGA